MNSNVTENENTNIWCSSDYGGSCIPGESTDPNLLADASGNIQESISVAPTGMGLGLDECLLWVPAKSNMHGAGKDGADIGATILYRYETPVGQAEPVLTIKPLWNATTGEFPCGATVSDDDLDTTAGADGGSCVDVHVRLNVNQNGCGFPEGYVGW